MGKSKQRQELKLVREKQGLCVYCGDAKPIANRKGCILCLERKSKYQSAYAKQNKEHTTAYRRKIRLEVINKYGGECVCCGETNEWFLTIDHKNNDGSMERKKLYGSQKGSSTRWFFKLKREPIRDDLRILCYNCNNAIAIFGVCPHDSTFKVDLNILSIDGRKKGNFDVGCKIEWPSDDELLKRIQKSNCSSVARELGVHDTAIRGRLKRRGLYHLTKHSLGS